MHLHLHLKQVFLDYGPPHGTWCFALERFNGILGSYHTNNRCIESQIMRKFCQDQALHRLKLPSDEQFCSLLSMHPQHRNELDYHSAGTGSITSLQLAHDRLNTIKLFACTGTVSLIGSFYEHVLSAVEVHQLTSIYHQLYPQRNIAHVPFFCRKYGRISLVGNPVGSDMPGRNNNFLCVYGFLAWNWE